jgi:hypothetical protein
MNAESPIRKDVEGSVCGLILSTVPAFSGGTEKTLGKVSQVSQRPGKNSNRHVSNEMRNLTTAST